METPLAYAQAAFSHAFLRGRHSSVTRGRRGTTSQRGSAASGARWTCASKAHPYGNGGLNNVCNWEGYNREEALAEFAKLKKEFEAGKAERERKLESL